MDRALVGRDVIPCGVCGCYVWLPEGCRHTRSLLLTPPRDADKRRYMREYQRERRARIRKDPQQ